MKKTNLKKGMASKDKEANKPRSIGDNLCKYLAENYPEQFIEWLFGIKAVGVKVLKTELSREPIRGDAGIFLVLEHEIVHLEFQTTVKSRPPIDFRMLDYYVGFKRKFPSMRIRQVLVVLKDTKEDVPEKYEDENCYFRYGVVKMWEEDPKELLKHKDLFALASLCRAAQGGENLLKQLDRKINEIKDIQERREKLDMARVFAGLRYNKNLVYEILRGGDMLEESVVVQDWIRRGVKEGRKKGIEEGLEKGLEQGREEGLEHERKLLTLLLERRFGNLSAKTREKIAILSFEQLEALGLALLDFKDKSELTKWLSRKRVASK